MSLKGFHDSAFGNSKVAQSKIISDTPQNVPVLVKWGNSSKSNIGLASKTKAAVNPTTDADDNPRAVGGQAPQDNGDESMTPSTKGGASGDGPTPGFTGSGSGIAELNGAQGN